MGRCSLAGSREPGAGSREPGAGSREPGALDAAWLRGTLRPLRFAGEKFRLSKNLISRPAHWGTSTHPSQHQACVGHPRRGCRWHIQRAGSWSVGQPGFRRTAWAAPEGSRDREKGRPGTTRRQPALRGGRAVRLTAALFKELLFRIQTSKLGSPPGAVVSYQLSVISCQCKSKKPHRAARLFLFFHLYSEYQMER
jgi:hypothetical protein